MKIIGMLILIGAIATSAEAQGTWKSTYKDDSVSVWLDTTQTMVQKDKTYKVRLKWRYAKDKRIDGGGIYRSMVEDRYVDCSPIRTKPITATAFDVKNRPVSSFNIPAAELKTMQWSTRPKGTSSAKAYEATCKALAKA
jgi:hypothetical protein